MAFGAEWPSPFCPQCPQAPSREPTTVTSLLGSPSEVPCLPSSLCASEYATPRPAVYTQGCPLYTVFRGAGTRDFVCKIL